MSDRRQALDNARSALFQLDVALDRLADHDEPPAELDEICGMLRCSHNEVVSRVGELKALADLVESLGLKRGLSVAEEFELRQAIRAIA
jgi:hypothetical protein